jgi:hypothetical protein
VLEQRSQLLGGKADARRKHASTELLQAQPSIAVSVELSNDLAAVTNNSNDKKELVANSCAISARSPS